MYWRAKGNQIQQNSGWFDAHIFQDWFMTSFLPAAKKQDGPEVLIGDNLSSHLNEEIIAACERVLGFWNFIL